MIREKRGEMTFLGLLLIIAVLFSLIYTLLSLFIYPSQTPGISGAAITDEVIDNYLELPLSSKLIIAGEWLLVLVLVFVILMKGKMKFEKEIGNIKSIIELKNKYKKSRSQTDLDVLYEILKEQKKLRLSIIAKSFKINNATAMEWAESLESGGLAEVRYPTVGDPKLILKQGHEDEEE